MNRATEQIIRWHLSSADGAEDHLETTIEALRAGMENGSSKSKEICAALLVQARAAMETSPDAEILARLFELHFELETLAAMQRQLDNA